jgi:2,3-bisphosphoglycerate-dependent phosphoglycerate mutase
MRAKSKLILLRHGESEWNRMNRFTGWVDIPLSLKGIEEAFAAGKKIEDIPIDVIFISSLVRAQESAMIAMSVHKSGRIPCIQHPKRTKLEAWAQVYDDEIRDQLIPTYVAWELNERMYGRLQGLNKQETMDKFGKEQVQLWRRSYDIPPPDGESLEMTAARAIPYFEKQIVPKLREGKNVLVSAHGNSLRAIVMVLDKLSKEEVLALELQTGAPIVYSYDVAVAAWSRDS